MNKQRRAALTAIQARIYDLGLEGMAATVREVTEELEAIRDAEQDAFDGLPERQQAGKGG